MAKAQGNPFRPVTVGITATFPKDGARKVTPADLDRAANIAAQAFRTHLEGRNPAYELVDVEYTVEYSYVQVSKSGVA